MEERFTDCVEATCEANDIDEACAILADLAHQCANDGANVSWSKDPTMKSTCGMSFTFLHIFNTLHKYKNILQHHYSTVATVVVNILIALTLAEPLASP